MKRIILLIFISNISIQLYSQHILEGHIFGVEQKAQSEPLPYANVFWEGTQIGTTADEHGAFSLKKPGNDDYFLIVSYVGFANDTFLIKESVDKLDITLRSLNSLSQVEISGKNDGNYISQIQPIKTEVITHGGLQKLACCNLSESFENNASVDVDYSDAVSGAKRIQMLGLSGVYSQLMLENIPFMHGLASPYGFTFVPGSWMQSIQISKGTSSVINGFESTTGQINLEYKKPFQTDKFYINLYGNSELKGEANIIANIQVSKKLATVIMAHGDYFNTKMDNNNDGFIDIPLGNQLNFVNRWTYDNGVNMHSVFVLSALRDIRKGGQMGFNIADDRGTTLSYGFQNTINRYQFTGKTGIILKDKPTSNIGIQTALTYHNQDAFYGLNTYNSTQKSLYLNVIYQSEIVNEKHQLSLGASFNYDDIAEKTQDTTLMLKEWLPGIFAQYSYTILKKLNIIAGVRVDYSSLKEILFTPRLHVKVDLTKSLVLRASGGRGYRNSTPFADNLGVMVSSRKIIFAENLKRESAWNYGTSLTQNIEINKDQKASISIDFFRTDFTNQVVLDLDNSPQKAIFYNLNGKSYSNSFQVDVAVQPIKRFDVGIAFRYNDVKTTIDGSLKEKPFVNKYKALLTLSYATKYEKWRFDFTMQYNGQSRIPSTQSNPLAYQLKNYSSGYFMLFGQITKKFKYIDIYAGVENITNYTQKEPILASDAPFGEYFDASLIWGPLVGRMFYGGLRFYIK